VAWTTDGISVKLARAEEHLKALDGQFAAHVGNNPYSIGSEFDPDTGWHTVRMVATMPPSPWIGVVIGDVAHNLRSALDHLAWQLATLDGDPPEPDKVQFPIFTEEPKGFLDRPCLSGMRPEHRAVLESLQPYNTEDGSALEWLAWINNRDKHKLLHTTISHGTNLVPHTLKAHDGYAVVRSEFGFTGLLDDYVDGAEIGRLLVEPADPELHVHMEFEPSFGIAFGDERSPLYGKPVGGTLKVLHDLIQKIVFELFDRPGQSGSPPWP
jgi:hypothetical protein